MSLLFKKSVQYYARLLDPRLACSDQTSAVIAVPFAAAAGIAAIEGLPLRTLTEFAIVAGLECHRFAGNAITGRQAQVFRLAGNTLLAGGFAGWAGLISRTSPTEGIVTGVTIVAPFSVGAVRALRKLIKNEPASIL